MSATQFVHLKAIVLDETRYWRDDITARAGKIYQTYLFDASLGVHCCEITPSYELWPLYATPLDEDEEGALRDEILLAESDEIRHFHCRSVDAARPETVQYLGVFEIDPDETRDQTIERLIEHYRGNPVLQTPRYHT